MQSKAIVETADCKYLQVKYRNNTLSFAKFSKVILSPFVSMFIDCCSPFLIVCIEKKIVRLSL